MPNTPLLATHHTENNLQISVFDLQDINDDIRNILDDHVCSICAGVNANKIEQIKRRLKNRFNGWSEDLKMGAVAEFFIHLYMRFKGYKQEFLFFNLEEGSIKKGFDGLYTAENTTWLMESKSGSISTAGISHEKKIKEAFADLKNKVTTGVSNNPWENAYNHASHRDVGSADNLRDNLKKMSEDFENDSYQRIEDLNIIPCATVFLNGTWLQYDRNEIVQSVKNIPTLLGKNIHAICVTQKSYDLFMEYIEE